MKILAAFDESPFSEATIPTLAMLASLSGVEIEPYSVLEITAAWDDDAIRKRRNELDSYLNEIATRLPVGSTGGRITDVAMFPMDAATVLIERANAEHPDLIALATHGRSGIPGMLLGSVAAKVLQSGVAPVLLVRPQPER